MFSILSGVLCTAWVRKGRNARNSPTQIRMTTAPLLKEDKHSIIVSAVNSDKIDNKQTLRTRTKSLQQVLQAYKAETCVYIYMHFVSKNIDGLYSLKYYGGCLTCNEFWEQLIYSFRYCMLYHVITYTRKDSQLNVCGCFYNHGEVYFCTCSF